MSPELMAALDARDDRMKDQLDRIGRSIGYGRAIQLLGQLWDDMMQASYPQVGRHQESTHRRTDIELIEAGLPLGRKVVYFQKRGRKGQITALVPMDFEIENVARVVSDTPLYGRVPFADDKSPSQKADDSQKGGGTKQLTRCAADQDGDCSHAQCPQLRDGEPAKSGRHCPLDTYTEED